MKTETLSDVDSLSPEAEARPIRNPNCVVCGTANPHGLRLRFLRTSDGARASWHPAGHWESFHHTVHGGIITAVLDEAMSQAIMAHGWEALTADLHVRFRDRVIPLEPLEVHGWVVAKRRRRITAEATLAGSNGAERAHAWATFLAPR